MKSFEEIEQTGEWWLQSGWESCTGLGGRKYSPEEVSAAIEILKIIFTAEWFRDEMKTSQKNIVVGWLIHSGPSSNDFLIDLARMIRSLRDSSGFQSICERLKAHESESAFFELQMADIGVNNGIRIEFPKSTKSKTPDVIAYFPDYPVAIECKRLDKEQWEIWVDNIHSDVRLAIARARQDRKFKIQFQLAPTLSDIHFNHAKEPKINEAIHATLVTQIITFIDKILQTGISPINFEIPSLLIGTIFPHEAQVEEASSGAYISTTAKLRRVFTNGFFEAATQLPKEMPGIVAVYSDYLPDPPFARIIFDVITSAEQERFRHIAALIIFPLQTYFRWTPPLLFENKHSSILFRNLKCASIIQDSFGLQQC